MQRTARGLDYRVRFVVPDLQPIDELQPTSCTWKCLAAEALGGHSILPAPWSLFSLASPQAGGKKTERYLNLPRLGVGNTPHGDPLNCAMCLTVIRARSSARSPIFFKST